MVKAPLNVIIFSAQMTTAVLIWYIGFETHKKFVKRSHEYNENILYRCFKMKPMLKTVI